MTKPSPRFCGHCGRELKVQTIMGTAHETEGTGHAYRIDKIIRVCPDYFFHNSGLPNRHGYYVLDRKKVYISEGAE
jgi:hypothetical protein